ncbi:MAG: type II toxin-antitoxin system PemK/MazF family toxin [bacterium]|nr:type II toxin-antitoxin system PemK/MazF family toxin [bacterium]
MPKIERRHIKKGDVWIIDNVIVIGHMQKGNRPHVVVTQITGETVTVAPCTSVTKKVHQKYVVELIPTKHNGLHITSFVLLSQSFAADLSLFDKKIGYLDDNEINRIQLEYVKYVTD